MRFQSTPSNSLVPNPRLDLVNLATVQAAIVAEGNRVSWTSPTVPREWRVFRLDASTNGPQVLVAILPADVRTWTDRRDAPKNRYRQGHAHTYLVFAVA